ncbi:MAG: zinc ribbon domain-containing protein [Inhella sp.]
MLPHGHLPLPALRRLRSGCAVPHPPEDNRERAVCTDCGQIHYENPTNVVGTLPLAPDGRVLLCRRAIEPQRGRWTRRRASWSWARAWPRGAARNAGGAGARVELLGLMSLLNVTRIGQVHLFYRARLLDLTSHPARNPWKWRCSTSPKSPGGRTGLHVRATPSTSVPGRTELLIGKISD